MGTEILVVSDHLLAAVTNGIGQGILITVLVALSFRLFGRTNAATRHAVWLCTLVLLVLLVVAHVVFHQRSPAPQPGRLAWTPVTPEQEIGALDAAALPTAKDGPSTETLLSGPKWPGDLPSAQERPRPDSLALTPTELPFVAQSLSVGSMPLPDATLRAGEPNNLAVEPLASATANDPSSWFHNATRRLANPVSLTLGFESRAARIAGAILLCGCLSLSAARLFMLLLRLHQIRKLKLRSFPASAAVNEFFQGLVTRLGVGRKVELKTAATSQSSFVLGFLHPVILVPAEPMEPAAAEQILRHELAHVRRRDDWANLLQHFILAAFPFHPAVCWISRRLSLEREIACDDYVLQSSGRPHAYALLLANLAGRMQRCPPLLAPGASNNKTQLQQRIDMILNTRRNTSPRLAARCLTFMASAAVLFAVTALCLAPRIVLAQSEAAPEAANAQAALVDDPVVPAVASVAVSFSPEPAVSSPVALPASPRIAANASGPKLKPGYALEIPGQPAVEPAPPTPSVLVAPALPAAPVPLTAPSAPPLSPGFVLSASPVPEPRPGRAPRSPRAESADSAIEERLERLEKMVESLLAHGSATQNPKNLKQYGQIDRKELPEIEARRHVEMALKQELDAREIERIKEHAKRESARAVEQAKRAAANVEKAGREQKRQVKRDFKEGSRKQLEELHKRLESLEREREKLEHQIEELERQQEQQDEQQDEEHDSEEQSHTSECNPDTKPTPRF